ncbi:hypothetical protein LXL04_011560 [Taraxacum kok-saghyz]
MKKRRNSHTLLPRSSSSCFFLPFSSSASAPFLPDEIDKVVKLQEELDIDVLVHGEPEVLFRRVQNDVKLQRNDMVEYFGEQLSGFSFTANGWVQSYGSRCVKPRIIYGDVSRPKSMTVFWSSMAQEMTKRPMKGMLMGRVTILNWSFVRNDQPRFLNDYKRSNMLYGNGNGIRTKIQLQHKFWQPNVQQDSITAQFNYNSIQLQQNSITFLSITTNQTGP